MIVKFKDQTLQQRYGRHLARAFSKHANKMELLWGNPDKVSLDQFTEEELLDILYRGEHVYWSLQRNDEDKIIGFKPYTIGSTIRYIKNRKANTPDDFMYDFNARL